MFKWTGHPFFDVGIATITAFANKQDPSQLTGDDLAKMVDYITREYTRQPLKSFLTVAFPNSGFTQPAFEKKPERRLEYASRVLCNYNKDTPVLDEKCVFTGEQAVDVAFGEKIPPGRAFRQHIPLLTGENVINFHSYGDPGLPVSGKAILAFQALPLGCAKCAGKLLAVHSDNPKLTLYFAKYFLNENIKSIRLAQLSGETKMPESNFHQHTLLINILNQSFIEAKEIEESFSITAYHFSNMGQEVSLSIYHLPLQMMLFLREMQTAEYRDRWNAIVQRAWEIEPQKKKKDNQIFQPRRNFLYEDLFKLPEEAGYFFRTYFLRQNLRYAKEDKGDPRGSYSLKDESDLISWKITAVFLRRVLNMEKERIEQIKLLGDQLANYVSSENDRSFFRKFYAENKYDNLRNVLIRANLAYVKLGKKPFLKLDPYIEVFEEGSELARIDWRLARDLVLIRMIEQLYDLGWFSRNIDAIPETFQEEENQK